jgi:hypothetical protein
LSPLDPSLEVNFTTTAINVSFEILEDQVPEITELFTASLFPFTPNVGAGPDLNVMITDNENISRCLHTVT